MLSGVGMLGHIPYSGLCRHLMCITTVCLQIGMPGLVQCRVQSLNPHFILFNVSGIYTQCHDAHILVVRVACHGAALTTRRRALQSPDAEEFDRGEPDQGTPAHADWLAAGDLLDEQAGLQVRGL